MNVYEMEGFLRGKCMPRDILVNESTAEYLVRKLNEATAVKAERDALAVENAALSAALSLISVSYGLSPHIQSICAVETQATSAAVAAIEARGVEKAAAALDAISKLSASSTSQANFRASAVYLRTEVLPGIGEAK